VDRYGSVTRASNCLLATPKAGLARLRCCFPLVAGRAASAGLLLSPASATRRWYGETLPAS
jgi:hypothetical protein